MEKMEQDLEMLQKYKKCLEYLLHGAQIEFYPAPYPYPSEMNIQINCTFSEYDNDERECMAIIKEIREKEFQK